MKTIWNRGGSALHYIVALWTHRGRPHPQVPLSTSTSSIVHIHNVQAILPSPQRMKILVGALIALCRPICITKACYATTKQLSSTVSTAKWMHRATRSMFFKSSWRVNTRRGLPGVITRPKWLKSCAIDGRYSPIKYTQMRCMQRMGQ